jgi:hypothetical protein
MIEDVFRLGGADGLVGDRRCFPPLRGYGRRPANDEASFFGSRWPGAPGRVRRPGVVHKTGALDRDAFEVGHRVGDALLGAWQQERALGVEDREQVVGVLADGGVTALVVVTAAARAGEAAEGDEADGAGAAQQD